MVVRKAERRVSKEINPVRVQLRDYSRWKRKQKTS